SEVAAERHSKDDGQPSTAIQLSNSHAHAGLARYAKASVIAPVLCRGAGDACLPPFALPFEGSGAPRNAEACEASDGRPAKAARDTLARRAAPACEKRERASRRSARGVFQRRPRFRPAPLGAQAVSQLLAGSLSAPGRSPAPPEHVLLLRARPRAPPRSPRAGATGSCPSRGIGQQWVYDHIG